MRLCSSFDSLQNSQILESSSRDLFICQSRCALLSVLIVSLFNCLCQRIAKLFTQKLPLGKGSGYTIPEHSAMPTQYMALALRRVPRIFLDIYISTHKGISISMVLVSVELVSLAQLKYDTQPCHKNKHTCFLNLINKTHQVFPHTSLVGIHVVYTWDRLHH